MRATLKQELPSIYVERDKMADGTPRRLCVPFPRFLRGGDRSFQVVRQTHLKVHLKLTQNYCLEVLALFLRRMII